MTKPKPDKTKCGAKCKSGKPCQRAPLAGRTRCSRHGGRSHPGGPTHHLFKTGRFSKFLPKNLQGKYETMLADKELGSLRDELALISARMAEIMEGFGTGEAGCLWGELKELQKDFEKAEKEESHVGMFVAAAKAFDLVGKGYAYWKQWGDLNDQIDRRARVAAAEWKRQADLQQVMTVEQVMTMAAAIIEILNTTVTDRVMLENASTKIRALIVKEDVIDAAIVE